VKRLLRSKAVQDCLATLIAAYVELTIATLSWRYENREAADAALGGTDGLIGLFWHGRIVQAMACRPLLGGKPRRVMISLSRDGEFIAMAAEKLGIPAIRGSAGRADGNLAKGGAAAFRRAVAFAREGGVVLITPDGPRGPNEVLPVGSVKLAGAAGCPVFLMGLAARPALDLGSWDRGRLPLPFARARLFLEGPLRAPADADDATLEALRADWQMRLRAAQVRAECAL
jgi:lysophospholipid acyltransferase (LPLAT)-like uncharacterized protein